MVRVVAGERNDLGLGIVSSERAVSREAEGFDNSKLRHEAETTYHLIRNLADSRTCDSEEAVVIGADIVRQSIAYIRCNRAYAVSADGTAIADGRISPVDKRNIGGDEAIAAGEYGVPCAEDFAGRVTGHGERALAYTNRTCVVGVCKAITQCTGESARAVVEIIRTKIIASCVGCSSG